jgi:hypothetical protein
MLARCATCTHCFIAAVFTGTAAISMLMRS